MDTLAIWQHKGVENIRIESLHSVSFKYILGNIRSFLAYIQNLIYKSHEIPKKTF